METKSGDLSWRCSAKGCKARVRTDAGPTLVIRQKNDHNHDPDDRGNERHVLRVIAKRKTVDDLSARPSKVIRSELQTMNEKSLEPKDIKDSLQKEEENLPTFTHVTARNTRESAENEHRNKQI